MLKQLVGVPALYQLRFDKNIYFMVVTHVEEVSVINCTVLDGRGILLIDHLFLLSYWHPHPSALF